MATARRKATATATEEVEEVVIKGKKAPSARDRRRGNMTLRNIEDLDKSLSRDVKDKIAEEAIAAEKLNRERLANRATQSTLRRAATAKVGPVPAWVALGAAAAVSAATVVAVDAITQEFAPTLSQSAIASNVDVGSQFVGQLGTDGSARGTAARFDAKSNKLTIVQFGDLQGVKNQSTAYQMKVTVQAADGSIKDVSVPLEIEAGTSNNEIVGYPNLSSVGDGTIVSMNLYTSIRTPGSNGETIKTPGAAIPVVIKGLEVSNPVATTTSLAIAGN